MDKAENDPCDFDGTPGHCEKAQRCRALPDGGESCRDSLNCVPGAAPKTEEPAPAEDPAKGDPAPTTEQPAPEDTKSSGGCAHSSKGSASAAPSGGALSMLSLIAGLGLLAGVKRRRSRSSL